ncbi:DUF11 domain-containing protein, partial [Hydrogenophaga sp.]|uniref:DUF11 domain-containing protein n=1 Tax=Hydrogenophaga sp. TaxID=1904254 RepID=UPI003F6C26CF
MFGLAPFRSVVGMRLHWRALLALVYALLLLMAGAAYGQTAVQNVARVASPLGVVNTNPSCTNGVCTALDADPVTGSADLSLTKASVNPNVAVGQTVTFTLTIRNAGPSPVTNATFTDVVPANLSSVTILSASGGATATVAGNTVNGTTSLASGATSSVVVRAVASSAGGYTNTASVTPPSGTTDPVPGNNTGTQTGTIGSVADLSLTKASVNPNVAVGQTVTFTLTIRNAGPSPVTNATFTDVVPANLSSVTILSASGGATATVAGNTVNGTTSLASGATSSVVVRAVASSAGGYTNTASVTPPSGTTDPVPGNNTGTRTGTIGSVADLSLTKASVNPNVAVGQTVTFTLTIRNAGPSPVTNATFTDVVPANLSSVTILSASGGATATVAGNTVNGTTSLASGATSSVVVRAVASSAGGYTNTASVTPPSGTTDPVPGNNTGT